MLEDDRPKVTMTKNELIRLLGISHLTKKTSKGTNKSGNSNDTMLDVICEFLVSQRDSHE